MPRILALTRYQRLGAASRIRFLQFLPELSRRGLDIDVNYLLDDVYVERLYHGQPVAVSEVLRAYVKRLQVMAKSRRYRALWIEKEALPWIPAVFERALLARLPYILDFDDAWFHRYDLHTNSLAKRLLGNKIDVLMRDSAAVVAGNDYLAERARAAGARCVHLIPSVVDLARYPQRFEASTPAPGLDNLVIGWIGTPLTARYLRQMRDVLEDVTHRGGVTLHIVGAGIPDELAGLPVVSIPWSEATEVAEINKFSIGIMPLQATPWELGKCGFKLLQVMAAGLPVVASAVGANAQIVRHGVNGFLASSAQEWREAIATLGADRALREQMGREARKTVEEHYSLSAVIDSLAFLLEGVATGREAPGARLWSGATLRCPVRFQNAGSGAGGSARQEGHRAINPE
jgi:glycosyltransferase involved in cell wall biosynthesis